MKVFRFDQYSDEWWKAHEGIPTSSCADKIITPKTAALSGQSAGYMNVLLAERAGFNDEPTVCTEWMERGLLLEPEARSFFEFDTGWEVEEIGFATNDEGTAGCSPDGLVCVNGETEGWENKCPKASTHIGYLRDGILPPYYKPQVHFSMAVTGLKKWHFQSYYPGLDPLIVLVEWDEYTDKVSAALTEFIERLEAESERLGYGRVLEKAA